jgi:hypothetical protein
VVAITLVVALIPFTGPDSQRIDLNPSEIVSVRPPRSTEHFGEGIRCLIHTVDGKFVAVIEDCDTVRQRLNEANQE